MKLAIFDLDFTIWYPEMYELRGQPKLKPISSSPRYNRMSASELEMSRTNREDMILVDSGSGEPMKVFPGASFALSEINQMKEHGHDIQAAVASKTDEPKWARICLDHLVIQDGTLLGDCFGPGRKLVEISYGSKVHHIERLHKKTGIPYEEMCFFDNEYWNIRDVENSRLPVRCYYTPDGMTRKDWEKAKSDFGISDSFCRSQNN